MLINWNVKIFKNTIENFINCQFLNINTKDLSSKVDKDQRWLPFLQKRKHRSSRFGNTLSNIVLVKPILVHLNILLLIVVNPPSLWFCLYVYQSCQCMSDSRRRLSKWPQQPIDKPAAKSKKATWQASQKTAELLI